MAKLDLIQGDITKITVEAIVNGNGEHPPGSVIRCVPVSLCEGADGDKPDAVADEK